MSKLDVTEQQEENIMTNKAAPTLEKPPATPELETILVL